MTEPEERPTFLQRTRLAIKGNREKISYLLAGGWNTVFGYGIGLLFYYVMGGRDHVVFVGVAANICAITMAFFTYKVFVFRTKGNWLVEYLRCYLVYGGSAAMGIGLLWLAVDGLGLPFWMAQGLVVLVTVVVSYLGHSRFTFRRGRSPTG